MFDHPYLAMYRRLHEKFGLKVQLNLFYDAEAQQRRKQEQAAALERERRRQRAVIDIKKKYGKYSHACSS